MAGTIDTITTEEFVALDALERIRAVDEVYGDKALQLASMQKPATVILHMIHRLSAKTFILFVDTQYHFKETLEIRDEYIKRFGLAIHTVFPEETPEQQFKKWGQHLYKSVDGQPECCNLRKEKPFLKRAREKDIRATLAGLMREEGGARRDVEPIGHDPRLGSATYHPLFDWTYDQVDAYIAEHDLPVHALYAKGYASIGCEPCTTPIEPGEDKRAGRWRHLRDEDGNQPEFCNINFSDLGGGI